MGGSIAKDLCAKRSAPAKPELVGHRQRAAAAAANTAAVQRRPRSSAAAATTGPAAVPAGSAEAAVLQGSLMKAKLSAQMPLSNPEAKKSLRSLVGASGLSRNAPTFVPGSGSYGVEASQVIKTSTYRALLRSGGGSGGGASPPSTTKSPAAPVPPPEASDASKKAEKMNTSSEVMGVQDFGQMWTSTFSAAPLEKSPPPLRGPTRLDSSARTPPSAAQDDAAPELLRSLAIEHRSELNTELAAWSCNEFDGQGRSAIKPLARLASSHAVSKQRLKTASFVMQDLNADLDRAVARFLRRLQTLQDLDVDRIPKRYAFGVHDCTRRAKQKKLCSLVIAADCHDNDSATNKIRDLLAFAYRNNIEVIFALDQVRLGLAVGKNMGVSVVGVFDVTGASNLYEDALHLARACRTAWLQRRAASASPADGGK